MHYKLASKTINMKLYSLYTHICMVEMVEAQSYYSFSPLAHFDPKSC